MKKSLKALIAVAASSATALAISTPSHSVQIGGYDDEPFTGVFSAEFEATRSCSISATPVADTDLIDGFNGRGTTIRLKRKAGDNFASGSVAITLDVSGANKIYFDPDEGLQVGAFDGNVITEDGDGSMSVTLDKAQEVLNRQTRTRLVSALEAAGVDDYTEDRRVVAEISNIDGDKNLGGVVLGGRSRNARKNAISKSKSLEDLNDAVNTPETRKAIVNMKIDDINNLGTSVIQATLVCAPVEYDRDSGTIKPNVDG